MEKHTDIKMEILNTNGANAKVDPLVKSTSGFLGVERRHLSESMVKNEENGRIDEIRKT